MTGYIISVTVDNKFDTITLDTSLPTSTSASGAVTSVNTQTGAVVLDTGDVASDGTNLYMTAAERSKLTAIESGAKDDQVASDVPFTADGDISSTDVQSAIVELRDDTDTKLANTASSSHTHTASDIASGTLADARISETSVTQHEGAITITESQISDLGTYANATHSHATTDITSGTFADARISESSVTQHQATITITESQISDYDPNDTDAIHDNVSAEISAITEKVSPASADLLLIEDSADTNSKKKVQIGNLPVATHNHAASEITSGTFLDARISESSVTQHEGAMSFTESQISDLQSYILAASTNTLTNKSIDADTNTITNIGSSEITADIVTGLTEELTPATGDFLLGVESGGALRKFDVGDLPSGGGSGDVTKVGTPVDNQLGVWTGDGTLEGSSALTFDGSTLLLDVEGSGDHAILSLTGGTSMAALLRFQSNDGNSLTEFGLAGGDENFFTNVLNGDFSIRAANNAKLHLGVDDGVGGNASAITIQENGNVGFGVTSPDYTLDINGEFGFRELSSDPADPDEGAAVIWQSDGTGTGDDGDVYMKVTAASTTKTVQIFDYSAGTLTGSGGGGVTQLSDLSDVNTSTVTNRFVLVADGVDFESRALVEADISDLDHTDANAIHDNTASEISAITEKTTPVSADLLIIEDSEDSNNKKRLQIGNLPSGGGSGATVTSGAGFPTGVASSVGDFWRDTNTGNFQIANATTNAYDYKFIAMEDQPPVTRAELMMLLRSKQDKLNLNTFVRSAFTTGAPGFIPPGRAYLAFDETNGKVYGATDDQATGDWKVLN